jgi:hypothetical protein
MKDEAANQAFDRRKIIALIAWLDIPDGRLLVVHQRQ